MCALVSLIDFVTASAQRVTRSMEIRVPLHNTDRDFLPLLYALIFFALIYGVLVSVLPQFFFLGSGVSLALHNPDPDLLPLLYALIFFALIYAVLFSALPPFFSLGPGGVCCRKSLDPDRVIIFT